MLLGSRPAISGASIVDVGPVWLTFEIAGGEAVDPLAALNELGITGVQPHPYVRARNHGEFTALLHRAHDQLRLV